jgi:hypothetical protein
VGRSRARELGLAVACQVERRPVAVRALHARATLGFEPRYLEELPWGAHPCRLAKTHPSSIVPQAVGGASVQGRPFVHSAV